MICFNVVFDANILATILCLFGFDNGRYGAVKISLFLKRHCDVTYNSRGQCLNQNEFASGCF